VIAFGIIAVLAVPRVLRVATAGCRAVLRVGLYRL